MNHVNFLLIRQKQADVMLFRFTDDMYREIARHFYERRENFFKAAFEEDINGYHILIDMEPDYPAYVTINDEECKNDFDIYVYYAFYNEIASIGEEL